MNEKLTKAYDIIKEEQRNSDNKANLFIVLITAFLSLFNKIPVNTYSPEEFESLGFVYLVLILPLLLLVLSLIPIYNHKYERFKKKKEDIDFNIFYWSSISNLSDDNELFEEYSKRYNEGKEVSQTEKDLLSQIRVNSEILERKIYLHKKAFFIIMQLILIFMVSILAYFTFKDSIIALIVYLITFECVFVTLLLKKPKWLYKLLSKI